MRYGDTIHPGQVFATADDTFSQASQSVCETLLGFMLLPTVTVIFSLSIIFFRRSVADSTVSSFIYTPTFLLKKVAK